MRVRWMDWRRVGARQLSIQQALISKLPGQVINVLKYREMCRLLEEQTPSTILEPVVIWQAPGRKIDPAVRVMMQLLFRQVYHVESRLTYTVESKIWKECSIEHE